MTWWLALWLTTMTTIETNYSVQVSTYAVVNELNVKMLADTLGYVTHEFKVYGGKEYMLTFSSAGIAKISAYPKSKAPFEYPIAWKSREADLLEGTEAGSMGSTYTVSTSSDALCHYIKLRQGITGDKCRILKVKEYEVSDSFDIWIKPKK